MPVWQLSAFSLPPDLTLDSHYLLLSKKTPLHSGTAMTTTAKAREEKDFHPDGLFSFSLLTLT